MVIRISELLATFKQERSFSKWVVEKKEEIKSLAYSKRNCVYRRELEDELSNFSTLVKAYKLFKDLRKKSVSYDLKVRIDSSGYHSFEVYFPVSQEEITETREMRSQKIKELGQFGSACVRASECLYDVCHSRVEKCLSGMVLSSNGSYDYKGDYVATTSVIRFK